MGVGVPFCGGAVWNRTTPSETTVLQTAVGTSQLFRPRSSNYQYNEWGERLLTRASIFLWTPVKLSSCPVVRLSGCSLVPPMLVPETTKAAVVSQGGLIIL